jgi:hypothetical protein
MTEFDPTGCRRSELFALRGDDPLRAANCGCESVADEVNQHLGRQTVGSHQKRIGRTIWTGHEQLKRAASGRLQATAAESRCRHLRSSKGDGLLPLMRRLAQVDDRIRVTSRGAGTAFARDPGMSTGKLKLGGNPQQ